MARVLALDCSTNVGWALFEHAAGSVRFGTWRAPKSLLHAEYGRSFVALEEWLNDMISLHAPDVVAFEAPITPFAGFIEQRSSLDIVRLLIGLATVVELVATRARLRCVEVPVPTAKKRVCGTGRATKRDMINAVVKIGHLVEDDHQADAIAVALATYDHLGAASEGPPVAPPKPR
jgi:Holliday junction resolvasome RuvABC endonuclease subunit